MRSSQSDGAKQTPASILLAIIFRYPEILSNWRLLESDGKSLQRCLAARLHAQPWWSVILDGGKKVAKSGAKSVRGTDDADQGGVGSITKAMSVLQLLGASRLPLTMTEIARETGMTASSCHDLVTTMVQLGMVQLSSVSKSYEIGARFVRLAKRALQLTVRGDTEFDAVRKKMSVISREYSVYMSILRQYGDHSYISTLTSEGSAPIRIRLPVGRVMPLFSGSAGIVFAHYHSGSPEVHRQLAIDAGLRTPKQYSKFKNDSEFACRQGWISNDGGGDSHLAEIAFPVISAKGELLAVLDAVMFQSHYLEAPLESLVSDCLDTCSLLATTLSDTGGA